MENHVNRKVKIVRSAELFDYKLADLEGKYGIITCQMSRKRNKGYFVKLIGGPYQGEREWFIPKTAVQIIQKF